MSRIRRGTRGGFWEKGHLFWVIKLLTLEDLEASRYWQQQLTFTDLAYDIIIFDTKKVIYVAGPFDNRATADKVQKKINGTSCSICTQKKRVVNDQKEKLESTK